MNIALFIIGFALFSGWLAIIGAKEDRALGFAIGAVLGAGMAGGAAWLWSWLTQSIWAWLLLLGFIAVVACIWFVVGVTGLLVQLLYRP